MTLFPFGSGWRRQGLKTQGKRKRKGKGLKRKWFLETASAQQNMSHSQDPDPCHGSTVPSVQNGEKKKNQPAKTPVVNSPVKAKISHQVKETVAKIREAVNLQNKEMYRKQTI